MLARIRQILAAPVFEDDEEKTRNAGLLNIILWSIFALFVPAAAPLIIFNETRSDVIISAAIVATLFLLILGLFGLLRRGRVQLASTILPAVVLVMITVVIFLFGGIRTPGAAGYLLVIFIAGLLLGGRGTLIFGLLSMLSALGVFLAHYYNLTSIPIRTSLGLDDLILLLIFTGLMAVLVTLTLRNLTTALDSARRNERAMIAQHSELQTSQTELEAHTHQLERRSHYLEATATIASDAASVLDLQELLSRAIDLIDERFDFYRQGIFLVDPSGEWVVLQAASGQDVQQILDHGYRLRVSQESIVGYVSSTGESYVTQNVKQDPLFIEDAGSTEIRSELALPLRTREEVIGVLDVQSTELAAFDNEDIAVLQTLADLLAIAINNARLIQQAQKNLDAVRRAYGELSQEAWTEMLRTRTSMGYYCDATGITLIADQIESEQYKSKDRPSLDIPITVRGHTIGTISANKPDGAGEWTTEDIALLKSCVEQMSQALESARLYQDTQRRAGRERLVTDITTKIRATTDPQAMLQTAVSELRKALNAKRAQVVIQPEGRG